MYNKQSKTKQSFALAKTSQLSCSGYLSRDANHPWHSRAGHHSNWRGCLALCKHSNFYVNALAAVLAHQTPSHVWDYSSFGSSAGKMQLITRQRGQGVLFDQFYINSFCSSMMIMEALTITTRPLFSPNSPVTWGSFQRSGDTSA